MKISDINPGTKVTVESSKDDLFIALDTTVCSFEADDDLSVVKQLNTKYEKIDFCYLDGIHEEEYLIDFTSKAVRNDLVLVADNRPVSWNNIRIMNVTLPTYGRVHVAMSTAGELPHNRRDSFRMDVDKEGEFFLANEERGNKCQVRDLSASGIGFVVSDALGIQEGMVVRVNFTDREKFYLTCIVRRIKELGPNQFLIGAAFPGPSQAVASYISTKQRNNQNRKRKRF